MLSQARAKDSSHVRLGLHSGDSWLMMAPRRRHLLSLMPAQQECAPLATVPAYVLALDSLFQGEVFRYRHGASQGLGLSLL